MFTHGRGFGWHVEDGTWPHQSEVPQASTLLKSYHMPSLRTINGVASMGPVKIAWIKDTEGNLLSIAQFALGGQSAPHLLIFF